MAEPVKEEKKPTETPETKGWLYKWTNYIKVKILYMGRASFFTLNMLGLPKALVCPSKWATLLLQEPGRNGSHMQVTFPPEQDSQF